MRQICLLALAFCLMLPSHAQDDAPTPYEIALQRIQEAEASGTTELDLSFLGLTELPPEIGNLNNLQSLNLSHNNLTTVPATIANLRNLNTFDLSFNQLNSIPPEFGNFGSLVALRLNNNQLLSLPPEFGNVSPLNMLDLSQNNLTNLPSEFVNLTALYWLNLDNNHLTSLPAQIGNLQALCKLQINNNQFHHLPSELSQIASLQDRTCYIRLDGNPLISPPQEVIAEGTPAVLDYLANQAFWHLLKLIVRWGSGIGLVAVFILGMRRRNRGKQKKNASSDYPYKCE